MNSIITFFVRIFRPIFNPFIGRARRLYRSFFRFPWIVARKFQRKLKRALFPKRIDIRHYVKFGRWYVAKRLLIFLSLAMLLLVYILFINPPDFVHKWTNTTNTIQVKADKNINYTGKAKIYNEKGVMAYQGGLSDGLYSGNGKYFDEEGRMLYEGSFENGEKHGQGKLYTTNGQMLYEGTFEHGEKHGQGKLYDENGQMLYEGSFEYEEKHGQGTLYSTDGYVVYKGEFQNGQQSGKGETYHPNGETKFRGNYESGVVHGPAEEYRNNGKLKYTGEFSQGSYSGEGTLFNLDESIRYKGGFENGQYWGKGTTYFPDGVIRYDGEFLAGKFEGKGQLFNTMGQLLYNGEFKHGQYSGTGTKLTLDGLIEYEGGFLRNVYSGQGNLYDKEGNKLYEGAFVQGDFHGEGKQFNLFAQPIYEGRFSLGSRSGIGSLYGENEIVAYKGFFKEDAIYYPGFIGLSTKQLIEILGEPDVMSCEESVSAEELVDLTNLETDFENDYNEDGSPSDGFEEGNPQQEEVIQKEEECKDPESLPFELIFHTYELTFTVEEVEDRLIGAVTEVYVWGDLARQLQKDRQSKAAKGNTTVPSKDPSKVLTDVQFYFDEEDRTYFFNNPSTKQLQYARITKR